MKVGEKKFGKIIIQETLTGTGIKDGLGNRIYVKLGRDNWERKERLKMVVA